MDILKTLIIVFLTVVVIYMLAPKNVKSTIMPGDLEKGDLAVDGVGTSQLVKAILRDEKQVLDAVITDGNVMYISVADDGTNRDSLAEYFCQVLKDKHVRVNRVKIVRVGSYRSEDRDNAYGVLLGESWCR